MLEEAQRWLLLLLLLLATNALFIVLKICVPMGTYNPFKESNKLLSLLFFFPKLHMRDPQDKKIEFLVAE